MKDTKTNLLTPLKDEKTVTVYLYDVPVSVAEQVGRTVQDVITHCVYDGDCETAKNLLYTLENILKCVKEVNEEVEAE